jgi:AraC-like DNA-binding protein
MAPLEYLTRWRMYCVRRALLDTDEPFAVIAERNGYLSRASCSQAFKRVHGHAPSDLRQPDAGAHI